MMKLIETNLLFTPGPTPTPELIRQSLSLPTIHHRTKEFESIFESVRLKLKELTKMPENLVIVSSGTGGMEATISYFSRKKVLVINSGKFGERFSKIAKSLSREVVEITNGWDTPASVESVGRALDLNRDIDCICFQICESSGGLKHFYQDIAKSAKQFNEDIFVVADGITAMGVEEIDISNIDALIGGSQKAFMLPPGIAIIGLSQRAVNYIEENDIGFYFNLNSELKNQRRNTTAYTASTSLIIGLKSYFDYLDSKNLTMSDVYAYTKNIAKSTRAALSAINLKIFPKNPSDSMTTIFDEDAKSIRVHLEKMYSVKLAGGQDDLKNKLFRVNHMGLVALHEILFCINAIELTLDDLKIRKFEGIANKIFLDNLRG